MGAFFAFSAFWISLAAGYFVAALCFFGAAISYSVAQDHKKSELSPNGTKKRDRFS